MRSRPPPRRPRSRSPRPEPSEHAGAEHRVRERAREAARRRAAELLPELKAGAGQLLLGLADHPDLVAARRSVAGADVIVLATPLYQAAYTGLVKAFLGGLPQQAFAGRTVVPIAAGGTQAHLPAVDYALRPVLSGWGCGT
ncbi:NAD(P)H-dependent oxidoreductase [[Actinomadura] parvosata]|uniref:NAD(P)H-dependent oxidoreductase n=1 Tax=[Actinomadura] parvosata TaxID=1955412 RepID=UPI00406C145A